MGVGGGGGRGILDLDLDWIRGPILRLTGRLPWSTMASLTTLHIGRPCHMMHWYGVWGMGVWGNGGMGGRGRGAYVYPCTTPRRFVVCRRGLLIVDTVGML